jgi:uncharacterized protein YjiS (DUF1127 family)
MSFHALRSADRTARVFMSSPQDKTYLRGLQALFAHLGRAAANYGRVRRDERHLSGMSEQELLDIGLSRVGRSRFLRLTDAGNSQTPEA